MPSMVDAGGDDDQGQGGVGQEQCVPLEPYPAPAFQAADQQGYEYPPRCVRVRAMENCGEGLDHDVIDAHRGSFNRAIQPYVFYPINRVMPPEQAFEAMVCGLDLMHHATKK